jgi:hypothetical protein
MIDSELKNKLLNKLLARAMWAQRIKDKLRKGFYRDAQSELEWVIKSSTEAIDLLKKETDGLATTEVNVDKT